MEIREIKKCRICGNSNLTPILNLGVQALSGRFPSEEEQDLPKAPLVLVKCNQRANEEACGLLQLKHSTPPEEMYFHGYGYRSGVNQTMTEHLKDITDKVQETVDLHRGDIVLDIGSNDATLLKSYKYPGLRRAGIDPTGEQFAGYYTDDIALASQFFSVKAYHSIFPDEKAKVITSIAMFYDLENPMAFISDIKEILDTNGIWVLEQSYMPTMLKMNSFDTVCHEHLEYYSLKQIIWMLDKFDMRVLKIEFNDINGGSFLVYTSHNDSKYESDRETIDSVLLAENEAGLDSEYTYKEFSEKVHDIRKGINSFLTAEKEKGKSIYIYGASTKGNVLLQFCNIDNNLITAAADRNPAKWGCRTPGTDIPIISEEEARKAKPDYFLVLPWHFRDEFIKREADYLNAGGRFIFPLPELEII
jgi:NDP-4-keto-2,6-dideoxyhexose 3-C-methyltransferase